MLFQILKDTWTTSGARHQKGYILDATFSPRVSKMTPEIVRKPSRNCFFTLRKITHFQKQFFLTFDAFREAQNLENPLKTW